MHKVSVAVTVLNEENTVGLLLISLHNQSVQPWEIVVCDGGSTDATLQILHTFKRRHSGMRLKIIQAKGNISQGRNTAIQHCTGSLLAFTDAGCLPEKTWLEELLNVYQTSNSRVIAGFYKGLPLTRFEQAVVPYVLVMPDALNESEFLPATRSMLIEKKVWQEYGGFDETLAVSEDYAFAKKLRAHAEPISVARKAVVRWLPRKNLREFFDMILKFAQYDIIAGIIRLKVLALFTRYGIVSGIVFIALLRADKQLLWVVLVMGFIYLIWSIGKNIRYVPNGWYWLPVLQLCADAAVLVGTIKGVKQKLFSNSKLKYKLQAQ